jgi:MYXO-CTERM domain-containing protein
MIKHTWRRRPDVAAALLLALSVTTLGPTVAAQEASPSGQQAVQASPAAQTNDDTEFPWGLLGLLGLGGLAGLRRRPEPVRDGPATVGVYDTPQR